MYKSHVGSQERGKFQPVKFMAQQAVEDLVSSYVMYLSPLIILLPEHLWKHGGARSLKAAQHV